MPMYLLNSKEESINSLKSYFKKFNIDELDYYLGDKKEKNLNEFFKKNVYDPDEIEIPNLIEEHFRIVLKKVFYLTTPLNLKRSPIKLSFVSSNIYFTDVFNIDTNIFINYSYLINIFEKIEYNLYNSVSQVYIQDNKIYDMDLLKKISETIYNVLQHLNYDDWVNFISDKYDCILVDLDNVKFNREYKIFKNPNTYGLIGNKIPIYWINRTNKIYGVLNSICSNLSYSPYYETKLIEFDYVNGTYIQISELSENKLNLSPDPYVSKANDITNCIIY